MGRPKELKNKTDLTIVLDQEQKDRLIKMANEMKITVSRLVRNLLFGKQIS